MTPVERALRERIAADGPLSVEAFMAAANAHYYATRDPLGAAGDFTTAPEISQMYGELIGAALADVAVRSGAPGPFAYAELGPGRGTLAADALRVLNAARIVVGETVLVETSPVLAAVQRARVPDAIHVETIAELTAGDAPLLLVASEFFDALPIRQTVDGTERRIIATADGLAFDREGPIVETSPARRDAMTQLAEVLVRRGGVAIVIDYGHDAAGAIGDTLQAVGDHRVAAVLDRPGEQDLTAHVDFAALRMAAHAAGCQVSRVASQGSWLETLGIAGRAMALAAANPQRTAELAGQRRRLCEEDEMGRIFKVMAVAAPGWPMPAGLA